MPYNGNISTIYTGFLNLWRFKQEMQDIFREKLDFWNNTLLRPLILKGTYHNQIAGYLFSKGYMQGVAELYESLAQQRSGKCRKPGKN